MNPPEETLGINDSFEMKQPRFLTGFGHVYYEICIITIEERLQNTILCHYSWYNSSSKYIEYDAPRFGNFILKQAHIVH